MEDKLTSILRRNIKEDGFACQEDIMVREHESIQEFLSLLITNFIQKLAVYTSIARGENPSKTGNAYDNFQKMIQDFVKPIVSLLGTEISAPVNIGLSLLTYTSYAIKKKIKQR